MENINSPQGFVEEDLQSSPEVNLIFKALHEFCSKAPEITKDKSFDVKKRDSNVVLYKIHFASHEHLVDLTKELLSKLGLFVLQPVGFGRVYTIIGHESGQWIRSAASIKESADGMDMGKAISFARRQTYAAILGLVISDETAGDEGKAEKPQRQSGPPAAAGKKADKPKPEPVVMPEAERPPFPEENMAVYISFIEKGKLDSVQSKIVSYRLSDNQKERIQDAVTKYNPDAQIKF